MCTTPNNSILHAPAPTWGDLDEVSNIDASEEEGEVMESHFTSETHGAADGRTSRHPCRSREHFFRSSSRSSSASSGGYLLRRRYHDYSSEDDHDFRDKRHKYDYKRKHSEGNICGKVSERKKLRFIPPVKKGEVELENLTSSSVSKQIETITLSPRRGSRLGDDDQNTTQEAGELGRVSKPTAPPVDITTDTKRLSTQSYHRSLGDRFQPPSANAKTPVVAGCRVIESRSASSLLAPNASRWNAPTTAAPSILSSNTATTSKSSRWIAPNNNAKMPAKPSVSRWISPHTDASKSSLPNLTPSTQHCSVDPHHLPLKKRFYADTSLKNTLVEFDRFRQHKMATTVEGERSTSVPHLDSEGESPTLITKDRHTVFDDRSNCRNEDKPKSPQLVARQRVVSKDVPLEHCIEIDSQEQVFCRQIAPLPFDSTQFTPPCVTSNSQKSRDAMGSESTEIRNVELQSYSSSKIIGTMSVPTGLSTTEPRSPPLSKMFSSSKRPIQSPFKRILSSVKPPSIKLVPSSNHLSGPSRVHDLRVSLDDSLGSSHLKKTPHIHIKMKRSISHDKSIKSPGRPHIHIKLSKITKSKSPAESLDSHKKTSELKMPCSPDIFYTGAGIGVNQKLPKLLASKHDAYPKKLHVPELASARVDIESKAQQILAKARMRLQASSGVKERQKSPSSDSITEYQHGASLKCETSRPAVLSESPLSACCEDQHSECDTATLDPSPRRNDTKHSAVQILHSEISLPRKSVASFAGELSAPPLEYDPSCESMTDTTKHVTERSSTKKKNKAMICEYRFNDEVSKQTSDSDTLSVDTNPKTFKRLRKKGSATLPKLVRKPSSIGKNGVGSSYCPGTENQKGSKMKSFDLSSRYNMDCDSDSSDFDCSTDTSSSSSTDSSPSSSSSSSCSSSSSSSSSSDVSSDSYSNSSTSSDSDSSSDFDKSSGEDDDVTSHRVVKMSMPKRTFKKSRRNCRSRRRSSTDVILGPPPLKEQTLTDTEIRRILQQDSAALGTDNTTWVRRSSRQPSKNLVNSTSVKDLLNRLQFNDSDMVVLKMKKYLNDPDLPPVVMNAALDALEENSNCQALYIQNFNNAMKDEQMMHLLRILQSPKCLIWCLNIGETYNVSHKTWTKFAKGLKHTKVTHMYASEHTITSELKDLFRHVIRKNRKKHDMHINPNNLDVIVKCTHCWWNPINAAALRPYIKDSAYEHILFDKEGLGLKGTTEGKDADTI